MQRNASFNHMAALYDQVRPSYPSALIDTLAARAGLSLEDQLLEIAAGTGKATIPLAKKGYRIHCVEIGSNLAALLKDKCADYPNVSVDVAAFEEWSPPQEAYGTYKLVYCAQAFHYIDPAVRYEKCHRLLQDGGWLALFWYHSSIKPSPVLTEIDAAVNRCFPSGFADYTDPLTAVADMEGSGLFADVSLWECSQDNTTTAEAYLKQMQSNSVFAVLEKDVQSSLFREVRDIIDRHGGVVPTRLAYRLYMARKK